MATRSPVSIAVDAGTTGVRALVVDDRARVVDVAYREITQHYPQPRLGGARRRRDLDVLSAPPWTRWPVDWADHGRVARAIGITNQRETVVAWDRRTGSPLHRAIVWQDRRTAGFCRELTEAGHLPAGPGAHRAGARPLLLGHQDALAPP